jgi:phage terminase small subunit
MYYMKEYKMKKNGLTEKERTFAKEYLVTLNGADAVRKAGYQSKRPDAMAYDLLRKPEVAAEIEKGVADRAKSLKLSAEQIVQDIQRLGRRAEELDKISEALKAQELLGRHLSMFTDRIETPGAPDAITINYHRAPRESTR